MNLSNLCDEVIAQRFVMLRLRRTSYYFGAAGFVGAYALFSLIFAPFK